MSNDLNRGYFEDASTPEPEAWEACQTCGSWPVEIHRTRTSYGRTYDVLGTRPQGYCYDCDGRGVEDRATKVRRMYRRVKGEGQGEGEPLTESERIRGIANVIGAMGEAFDALSLETAETKEDVERLSGLLGAEPAPVRCETCEDWEDHGREERGHKVGRCGQRGGTAYHDSPRCETFGCHSTLRKPEREPVEGWTEPLASRDYPGHAFSLLRQHGKPHCRAYSSGLWRLYHDDPAFLVEGTETDLRSAQFAAEDKLAELEAQA